VPMGVTRMGFSRTRLACLLIAAAVSVSSLAAQTLADRARELRKEKRTPSANDKVFTNETLNLRPGPSITTGVEKPADATTPAKADAAAAAEDAAPEMTPDEAKAAAAGEYRAKIEKAKGELATLQRELDIAQREAKLRQAQFYSDAGNRLRNERAFADEQRKTQADMADKQAKITATTALLESLRSEARRAGVPAGQIP
jgi:hypothetical protein